MDNMKNVEIIRYKRGAINKEEDTVVVEYPFTIFLNDKEFVTLLCSPKSLEYLAVGFLSSEGIINSKEDIDRVIVDEEKGYSHIYTKNKDLLTEKLYGKRTITSGCGKGTIFYNVLDSFKSKKIENITSVNPNEIINLIKDFNKKSEIFLQTGGVHSCSLCSSEKIILFEEDIGRHNALDKILGKCVIDNINLKNKIILTSGRISSEILIKIAKRKIPVVVSRSAPTDLAVDLARKLNITLIGFARGEKMNIYSTNNLQGG